MKEYRSRKRERVDQKAQSGKDVDTYRTREQASGQSYKRI